MSYNKRANLRKKNMPVSQNNKGSRIKEFKGLLDGGE